MKVIKFGGSSVASATQLKKVLSIVKSDPERKFVVVSAPGKRDADDEKVTDLLIQYAQAFIKGAPVSIYQEKISQRYQTIADDLNLVEDVMNEIRNEIYNLAKQPLTLPEAQLMDTFKASGENNQAKLVASYFNQSGVPAHYLNPKDAGLIVSNNPGDAHIIGDAYNQIYKLRENKDIVVIPGFFGYTEEGNICTFSRGGSDITGSIIAAGVQADLYENFTDVDAIFVAHPGIINQPKAIKEMTYREMRELAYAGFAVFHDEALMPAYRAGVPVQIKNTNNPSATGTRISPNRHLHPTPVTGIASDTGFTNIYISKYLMNKEIGFGLKVLKILTELNLNYEHMPSGIDDISVILRSDQLTSEIEKVLIQRFKQELDPDDISINHDFTLLMIVGEGMKNQAGVTAKGASALAKANVNIEMINQGSSEVSIMFGINEEDEAKALTALYNAYFQA